MARLPRLLPPRGAVPLLIVMYVAYRRLRGHIKSLEDQIAAQHLAYQKLREANRGLQADLKRIESRMESRTVPEELPKEPFRRPVPAPAEPPAYRFVAEEPAIPPALPVARAAVREEPMPAARRCPGLPRNGRVPGHDRPVGQR
jgi:hypothetical protein